MIGHKELVEARINGYQGSHVWVHVIDREPTSEDIRDAQDALQNGFKPHILITTAEPIYRLPLLGVRGLTVHVTAPDDETAIRLVNQLSRFKPAQILATTFGELVQEIPQ